MTTRECHPCTECCRGWVWSPVLDLRVGKGCEHCSKQGCGIYEQRPADPCRSFKCAWLTEEDSLPDHMRPDLSGVIVMLDRNFYGWEIITAVPVGEAIPKEALDWLLDFADERKRPLVFYQNIKQDGKFVKTKSFAAGPPAFLEDARKGLNYDDIRRF